MMVLLLRGCLTLSTYTSTSVCRPIQHTSTYLSMSVYIYIYVYSTQCCTYLSIRVCIQHTSLPLVGLSSRSSGATLRTSTIKSTGHLLVSIHVLSSRRAGPTFSLQENTLNKHCIEKCYNTVIAHRVFVSPIVWHSVDDKGENIILKMWAIKGGIVYYFSVGDKGRNCILL